MYLKKEKRVLFHLKPFSAQTLLLDMLKDEEWDNFNGNLMVSKMVMEFFLGLTTIV